MNALSYHALVNHIPLLFPIAGAVLLLLGLSLKAEAFKRAAYVLMMVGGIATWFALESGEKAEHALEESAQGKVAYGKLIHEHEEHAETFSLFSYGLAGASCIGLFLSWKKHRWSQGLQWMVLILFVATLYFGYETAEHGGDIVQKAFKL